jgi:hypothetical protein
MKTRSSLTLSFLAAGLFLLAFMFISVLGGSRIGFLYGRTAGFSTFRSVVQWAGLIAALGFFVAGLIVSVAVAIRPASWLHKIVAVLPILLLLFAAAGIVSAALGIGAVGNLAVVPLLGPVTFATGWLALGGLLAVVAVVLAVATGQYSPRTARAATLTMGVTSLASAIAAVAMIGVVILVANNQPSLPNFRGGEGAATTFVSQPAVRAPQAGPTPGARQGGQNGGQGQGGRRQGGGEGGEGAFPQGRFPEGGFQGGPGGGLAAARQQFIVTGVLMVILAIVQVFATLVALAGGAAGAAAATAPETAAATAGGGHGVGGAILAAVGVALVIFGLIQLVPVQRTNPPVQTTVNWDSPQTQQLWDRACADCHSNQTQWPWFTAVAPGSWLTASHVNAGRQRFNISVRSGRAGESVQQIRSGQMPLADYVLIHPNANLTDAEKQELMQGLQKTFGG